MYIAGFLRAALHVTCVVRNDVGDAEDALNA